jgi:hypothetical protein
MVVNARLSAVSPMYCPAAVGFGAAAGVELFPPPPPPHPAINAAAPAATSLVFIFSPFAFQ